MRAVTILWTVFVVTTLGAQPVGYHPSQVAYYNAPYFANALYLGGEWYAFSGSEFGTRIAFDTPQFENGYPKFLQPGQKLRALLFGLNIDNPYRPAGWPSRGTLAKGRIVVTWKGNADIRLASCTPIEGGVSGNAIDGRRTYDCAQPMRSLEVHSIVAPLTEIRVWPAALEGQLFHPLLLQRLADAEWAFIRFMDWGATNGSTVKEWSDRRLPSHIFMDVVAYEHMVALCNASGRNLWINIPHLAGDDFTAKLAKLIRFGSDGVNPYDAPQANPRFAPLRSDLRVYVEYSNEIWSGGVNFPQGDWAEAEAAKLGISRARFNARRFADTWRIFQQVFGGTDRLVRVAATFTANETYTRDFVQELGAYGATLTPQVRPDVLAVTTYFGNGIQQFVRQKGFTDGKLYDDPYWTSARFNSDLATTFDEWTRRILAGDSSAGSGPDATAIGGGFSASLRAYGLPIVAYEGGPSLYTDDIDGNATNAAGVPSDDGVTTFVEAMNRDPRIAGVYRIHLELAKSKGLRTHTPYTDTSPWSRYGQWGHLETLDQSPSSAPKYALMLEHFAQFSALRSIDEPRGAAPQFTTAAVLPPAIVGQPYVADIDTSGGDGARTAVVVGAYLDPGLSISDALRISGMPTVSRKNYILARVSDADGDPAWRIFTLESFGGLGTLLQSDFRGTSPALSLPWTPTFVRAAGVTWSGWILGGGAIAKPGNDAIVFAVSAPSAANETLAQAIADNEYLSATIAAGDLRNAQVRFTTRRIGFHAPLGYALWTSAGGVIYTSSEVDKDNVDEIEHVVTLPASTPPSIEIRIYAFGAQFDGHATSLTGFKVTSSTSIRRRAASS